MLDIPVRYMLARVARSPWPLVTAAVVSMLVMAAATMAHALCNGATHTWLSGGRPDGATLMAADANSNPRLSSIDPTIVDDVLRTMAGWCRPGPDGPLCSPESLLDARVSEVIPRDDYAVGATDTDDLPVTDGVLARVRGVTAAAWPLRSTLQIVEGRQCRAPGELAVGVLAAMRLGLPDEFLAVGNRVRLLDRDWTIVGRFVAPADSAECEVWCPLDDVRELAPLSLIRLGLRDRNAVSSTSSRTIQQQLGAHPEWKLVIRRDDHATAMQKWYAGAARLLAWLAALLLALLGGAIHGLVSRSLVDDRRDDIALLGRIGAPGEVVEWQVALQNVLPLLAGLLVGWLLTLALDGLAVMPGREPLRLLVSTESHVLGLLALLVAAAIGMWPALGMARRITNGDTTSG